MIGNVGKSFSMIGKIIGESYKFLKLIVIMVIVVSTATIAWYVYNFSRKVSQTIGNPIARITGTVPIPANVPEEVSDDRLKCRSYTMLADFEGSANRLEDDKLRILRTVANFAKTQGVDECEMFHRQMELVTPGWGKRRYSIIHVPDRTFGYIETTFSESARNAAFLLAKRVAEEPDASWQAIVLVRPDRPWTLGNQKPDEIVDIKKKLDPVSLDGPSDFEFFKPKPKTP
jgi:hypothetical protein